MKFASNASKLHRRVGEVLSETRPFSGLRLEQEVPVSSLFPEYSNNRDRYDWVVPELSLIIEAHGKQHYEPSGFGEEYEKAIALFQRQQFKDAQKKEVALLNNWTFLEIPYTDEKKLDSTYILDLYNEHLNLEPVKKQKQKKQEKSSAQLEFQKKQREEYNRQQRAYYRKIKELRKNGNYSG